MKGLRTPVVLLGLVVSTAANGQTIEDKQQSFGAFLAPAVLPSGSSAAYAYAGVPRVGGGYRQGFGLFEIDARMELDYFALAIAAEVYGKYLAYTEGPMQLAPSLGLGVVFDSGSRYIDEYNFGYVGLRLVPGGRLSYRVAETASVVGDLSVPIDISFAPGGGSRYTPLVGGGGELYLGDDITAAALAQLGVDVIKEPLGVPQARFAFALRVGLGYRFF